MIDLKEEKKEELRALLMEKSVRWGKFTLASGKESDLYIDCRVTAMDPRGASLIGEVGLVMVREKERELGVTCAAIGGMTLGADPISLAVGMASLSDGGGLLQVFTVRKEEKGYGQKKRIEGNFPPEKPVIVVDDVVTTGGSTLKAIKAIREAGGKVQFAFVLVDRQEGAKELIEAEGVPVVSLFDREALMD